MTSESPILLKAARVWTGDGEEAYSDWAVLVDGERVVAVAPLNRIEAPADAKIV